MTITELKYIVAVAKEGHFGRAASSVFVSQPTLSIGIKKLESELGVKIFERLSNKVVPTKAGQRIIEAAKATLVSTDVIRSIADEEKGEWRSEIKLGAIYTMCPYLLPKIIPDLQKHTPSLRVFIKEDYTHGLIESLKSGELDLAIVSLPLPASNLFVTKTVACEDFYVVLPSQHHLTKKKALHASDLADERVFLLGGGNCFRDQVLKACPDCLREEASDNKIVEGGSLETIRMMVAGGLGVSVFPSMALTSVDNVSVRPFASPRPSREIAVVWRKSFIQQQTIDAVVASVSRCTQAIKPVH